MLSAMLKLLFVILISMQSLTAYGETTRKSLSTTLSFTPALELLESKYGRGMVVLKGADEPYTGPASSASSIWKDMVVKESYIDGQHSLGTRMYYSKSTGEKLNGEFKAYYPDGAKYGVISLLDGKQDGLTTSWHPNGNLKSILNYSMGVEDGKYELYYENGNKKQTGVAGPNDSRQWTDWNISGYKESFYHFKFKDKPPISSKHWDSKGNPIHRPKDFQINITDKDDTITPIGNNDKGDNMMEFYISIYMPLAIAILVFLPLLGAGIAVYVLRRRK
jgi:antitoxin component YwqK of YwqJK toxin-antitoxin module